LYVITDLEAGGPSVFKKAGAALRNGADILQLRSKTLPDREFLETGRRLRRLARRLRKYFIVNDRPHIAKLLGADGLHLGQDDLPIREARRIVGGRMIIGKSTHSMSQALRAEREGADYIGVGPVFSTPTKPDYPAVGLGLLGRVAERVRIPFVAIGGINADNIRSVIRSGARCAAVVRAVTGAKSAGKAARNLKNLVLEELEKKGIV
jgi:thiamine-phosphate pyrophosphorylase